MDFQYEQYLLVEFVDRPLVDKISYSNRHMFNHFIFLIRPTHHGTN